MPNYQRPEENEYGTYYRGYIDKLGSGDIMEILSQQMKKTVTLIEGLSQEQAYHRYAENKWSVKEVIGHMIDSERVFAYRGLSFARGETKDLPGFDQDAYVSEANFNERTLESLKSEYTAVRESTLALFQSFDDTVLLNRGKANGYSFTVRSMPYIIAGHEKHHQDILQEKYGLD